MPALKDVDLIFLSKFYSMTFSFPVTDSKEQNLQHNYAQLGYLFFNSQHRQFLSFLQCAD